MHQSSPVDFSLIALLQALAQAHFLHTLSRNEAIAVLKKRHHLAQRLLALRGEEAMTLSFSDASSLMMDHYRTLLEAEMHWLQRAIVSLQSNNQSN